MNEAAGLQTAHNDADNASSAVATAPVAPAVEPMRVGTLTYTKFGLAMLFIWLLWGDFCFTMMGFLKPNILPLQLKQIGASNQVIAALTVSIPSLMAMILGPIIAVRSDRYRSRLGRRIPFLMLATPGVTIFLILLGFFEPIAHWFGGFLPAMSPHMIVVATVSVFVVAFQFFELLVSEAYTFLLNDVVPEAYLNRFLAMFNIVNRVANFVFCMFILGKGETHAREIYVIVAVIYCIAFTLICWRVREGSYPPPPPPEERRPVETIKAYVRECFGRKYFVYFFLGITFYRVAGNVGAFSYFFAQSIGVTMENVGAIAAWTGIPVILLMYPLAKLVDRIQPIRGVLICLIAYDLNSLAYFFFVYDLKSYIILSCLGVIITALMNVSWLPMFMRILPKDRFGQFMSAAGVLGSAASIVFAYAAGAFMDWVNNYRYVHLWGMIFQTLCLVFLYLVYRHWRVHGDTRHETQQMETAKG